MGKEGDVVKEILAHYKDRPDIRLFRVHSGKVRVKGGFMQLAPSGTPDICGYWQNRFIGIEAKNIHDKYSDLNSDQVKFMNHAKSNGSIHIKALTLQDVIDIIGF